jgi:hemerythrin-like domain-containing protein
MDILSVIKEEHRAVGAMFDEVEDCEPEDERIDELARTIERALSTHLQIEERLLYSQLRDRASDDEEIIDVFEAYTEHEVAKHLMKLLNSGRKRDGQFKAELHVLGESVKHHVQEEESKVFSIARELMDKDELDELGEKWEKAKQRLASRASSNGRRGSSHKKTTPARTRSNGSGRKRTPRKR